MPEDMVTLYRVLKDPMVYHRYAGCSLIKRAVAKGTFVRWRQQSPLTGATITVRDHYNGESFTLRSCRNCGK